MESIDERFEIVKVDDPRILLSFWDLQKQRQISREHAEALECHTDRKSFVNGSGTYFGSDAAIFIEENDSFSGALYGLDDAVRLVVCVLDTTIALKVVC